MATLGVDHLSHNAQTWFGSTTNSIHPPSILPAPSRDAGRDLLMRIIWTCESTRHVLPNSRQVAGSPPIRKHLPGAYLIRSTTVCVLHLRPPFWRSAKARRVRCSCLLGSRPPEAPEDQRRKYKKTFRTPLSQRGAKVFLLLLRGRSVAYSQSTKNGSQSTFQSTSVDWDYISYT